MLKYAGGGNIFIEVVTKGRKYGIRLIFKDQSPGISDINTAMKDGWSTSKGLGLGLPDRFYERHQKGIEVKTLCVPIPGQKISGDGYFTKNIQTRRIFFLAMPWDIEQKRIK